MAGSILDTNDGSEHSFPVCVPDMDIFTERDTFADAVEMARDAIGPAGISMEDNKEELPVPCDRVLQDVTANKNLNTDS